MRARLVQSAALVVLLAIAWLAYDLRTSRSAAAYEPGSVDSFGVETQGRWWIDDAASAYHLRRIQLTLLGGEVPKEDRYWGTEAGQLLPMHPFTDAALSAYASIRIGDPPNLESGGVSGPVLTDEYEVRLENLLARVGPWLGVWTTLLVALGAGQLAKFWCRRHPDAYGTMPWLAALLAALIFATSPLAIWYGGEGRIGHEPIVLFLFALHWCLLLHLLSHEPSALEGSSRRSADLTWGAIGAGAVAGLSLLTWSPGMLMVGFAGAALLVASWVRDTKSRQGAAKSGLLYFLTAAAVTLFPAIYSPWNAEAPGSWMHLTRALPGVLVGMGLLFGVPMFLSTRRGIEQYFWGNGVLWPSLRVVPTLYLAILVLNPGRGAWLRGDSFLVIPEEARSLYEIGSGSHITGALIDLGWVGLLVPFLVCALAWGFRGKQIASQSPRLFLLLNLLGIGALCLFERRFCALLSLPLAIGIGAAFVALWLHKGSRMACSLGGLLVLACLSQAMAHEDFEGSEALLAKRRAVALALGELREPGGSWRHPELRPSRRILAGWELGPLAMYHARLPLSGSIFLDQVYDESGPRELEPESLLMWTHNERFLQQLDAHGIVFVAVTARQAMGMDTWGKGPSPEEASMVKRLGLLTSDHPVQGLRLVSRTLEQDLGPDGVPIGPVLSIWKRDLDS